MFYIYKLTFSILVYMLPHADMNTRLVMTPPLTMNQPTKRQVAEFYYNFIKNYLSSWSPF